MTDAKTALVTGASRGIGREAAINLARKGFDVAIGARTVVVGESHHDFPLPGTLEQTAAQIDALGQRALVLRMDLVDREASADSVERVLDAWGRLDVLVNNAIYQGPGTEARFMDLDPVALQRLYQGNVFSQVAITQRALSHMLQHDRGRIINMVSHAGLSDPSRPVDEGGWGFAYASSKAAFHRMAGILKVELKESSILAINVDPGLVITEFLRARGLDASLAAQFGGVPPSVIGAVIAWLASEEAAVEFHGETVMAQHLALKKQLHADWRPAQAPGIEG